jgi:hypothetical protein
MKKILLVALAALILTGCDDAQLAIQQQAEYCEMVTIHKNTGGQYGWPDFRNNFDKVCKG